VHLVPDLSGLSPGFLALLSSARSTAFSSLALAALSQEKMTRKAEKSMNRISKNRLIGFGPAALAVLVVV